MRIKAALVGLLLAVIPLAQAGAGIDDDPPAGIDKQATLTPTQTFDWTGSTATGFNLNYWDVTETGAIGPFTVGTCTKDPQTYCDKILLEFSNPLTQAEIDALIAAKKPVRKTKTATVRIDTFTPTATPLTDFDLLAYESDSAGTKGPLIVSDGSQGAFNPTHTGDETVSFSIVTTPSVPSIWVLIEIPYFFVTQGSYHGNARF